MVLLSPRYLSRLWCVFEISTFLQDRASINKIQIMPLKTALLLLMVASCWHLLASYYFSLIRNQVTGQHWRGAESGLTFTFAMLSFCSVIVPLSFYVGIGHPGFVCKVCCFRRAKYVCMCINIYIYMYLFVCIYLFACFCLSIWGTTLPGTYVFTASGVFRRHCGPKVLNFHEFHKFQSKLEKICFEVWEIPNSNNSRFQKFQFTPCLGFQEVLRPGTQFLQLRSSVKMWNFRNCEMFWEIFACLHVLFSPSSCFFPSDLQVLGREYGNIYSADEISPFSLLTTVEI